MISLAVKLFCLQVVLQVCVYLLRYVPCFFIAVHPFEFYVSCFVEAYFSFRSTFKFLIRKSWCV